MIFEPKFFDLHELMPEDIFNQFSGDHRRGFGIFDINALVTLDMLRLRYGVITVNNWRYGGSFSYSGFRPFDCEIGAEWSTHKFAKGFDCKFKNVTADEVREDMRKDNCFRHDKSMKKPDIWKRINRIEEFEGMSWFHFDTGNHDVEASGVIKVFGG